MPKAPKIRAQQADMPRDDIDASLVLRLGKVSRRAVRKSRTGMRLAFQLRFDAGNLGAQALFGVLLVKRPKSKKNAYATMLFVDDAMTRRVDGNPWSSSSWHESVPLSHFCGICGGMQWYF